MTSWQVEEGSGSDGLHDNDERPVDTNDMSFVYPFLRHLFLFMTYECRLAIAERSHSSIPRVLLLYLAWRKRQEQARERSSEHVKS